MVFLIVTLMIELLKMNLRSVLSTYANCNIDLLKNDKVVNISDLKKRVAGKKTINNITINGSTAYLCNTWINPC